VAFYPGGSALAPDGLQLAAVGRALGELHRQGADLSLPGVAHTPEVLLPAGRRVAERLAAHRPQLSALLLQECRWQGRHLPDPALPGGLIHADLFRDNVLFAPGGNRVAGLLDFHLGGRGPWLFDLAVVMLDWCWGPRGVDSDRARALLRGYRGVRPVAGAEYRHLPVLLRRAALRYLCLRCERFLLPDRERVLGVCKDPREFAAKIEALREAGEPSPP
jgi:homoserine kinase type II